MIYELCPIMTLGDLGLGTRVKCHEMCTRKHKGLKELRRERRGGGGGGEGGRQRDME